ncbi:MAG: hypothetical protein WC580_04480 [Agrococcus sp.]
MERVSSWPFRAVCAVVLVYVLMRPVGHPEILYPALALLAVASAAAVVIGRRWASQEVVAVAILVVIAGLIAAFVGAGNPGMTQHVLVWVGAPLLFAAWALGADERMLRTVLSAIAWATVTLSVLILLFVGAQFGLPQVVPQWLIEEGGGGFNIEQGATAIRLYGLSTLAAAAPMWVVAAFVPPHPLLPPRWLRIVAAGTAVGATLVGGRNAIVLVLVLVPLAVLGWTALARRRGPRRIHPLLPYAGLLCILAIPWIASNPALQRTWNNLVGFFADDGSQPDRVIQADRLITAWLESPWIGHGLGAVIDGYSRSEARPWNFELQYHLMLFQFGIVGLLILGLAAALAVVALVRATRARPDMWPVFAVTIAGGLAMSIANASNPYLQAPGHMWAIWLPLMAANVALASRRPTDLTVSKTGRLALAR